jgi:hypothetical protein
MADALFADPKPLSAFRLISVWMFAHIPRQNDPVDLRSRFVACTLWFDPVLPPHHRCDSNAKPSRHLSNCKAFLLSDRKHLSAKIYGVGHPNIMLNLFELCYISTAISDGGGCSSEKAIK